jgi:hypothetical protein
MVARRFTMNDKLSEALECLVDDYAGEEGDWPRVLQDAGEVDAPLRRGGRVEALRSRLPRRSRRAGIRLALAAGVAAAAALAGISVIPGGNGCTGSVLACASAAVDGEGDVVHMVVRSPGPFATPENVYDSQMESWHDIKTGESYSIYTGPSLTGVSEGWETANGDRYGRYEGVLRKWASAEDAPGVSDPFFEFFGAYEEQLRNGTAMLAGETVFQGRDAYMIDFPYVDDVGPTGKVTRAGIRVLVDRESYEPLGFGHCVVGERWIPFIPRVRRVDGKVVVDDSLKVKVVAQVVSAEFVERTPGMFDVPKS